MNKSQRIHVARRIANSLAEEDWRVLDFTLQQFSIPTSNTWPDNDRTAYVLHHLSSVSDMILLELSEHLFNTPGLAILDETVSSATKAKVDETTFDFWKPDHVRLFISHVATHKDEVAALQRHLERYGISAFVAHNDIEPAALWENEIINALRSCHGLLALLTDDFHQSKWTDQEIGVAMGRTIPVIPIQLGAVPYGFMGRYQGYQAAGKSWEVVAAEIVKILAKHEQMKRTMAYALVWKLERSGNFASAKETMTFIERSDYCDEEIADRMRKAINTNSQVGKATGVPFRIREYIALHCGDPDPND